MRGPRLGCIVTIDEAAAAGLLADLLAPLTPRQDKMRCQLA